MLFVKLRLFPEVGGIKGINGGHNVIAVIDFISHKLQFPVFSSIIQPIEVI